MFNYLLICYLLTLFYIETSYTGVATGKNFSMLKVKHLSKDSFMSLLKHIIGDVRVRKVCFSQKEPRPDGRITLMTSPSLDIPLRGRKHMNFASGGEIKDLFLSPGEIHFCPPMHWKKPLWDSLHEMSSIVYHPDYVRLTYINYNKLSTYYDSHSAKISYHTSIPLEIAGISILRTLTLMADSGNESGAEELISALLKITLRTLEKDTFTFTGKAQKTCIQIKQYVQDNFSSSINRAHVASVFKINPSYISRLFNEQGEEGFNQMLRRLRLDHAALLATQTNLTVDEIADSCGYLSSTYFIAAFKKHFGVSPGRYRCINQ